MSSKIIIVKTIEELKDIMIKALTGTSFGILESKYVSLRRRLIAYKPLLGEVPKFLKDSHTLMNLWHSGAGSSLETYEERRNFIKKNYTNYYNNIIGAMSQLDFEEELLNRDISIEDEIGIGGFGVVHKVHHIVLNEYRAVKKLDPIFQDSTGELNALRRFAREIKILNDLDNKYIIKVFDAGIADKNPYYIMEFFEGLNLQAYVDANGVFELEKATSLMLQVLDGISHAHETEIIHRDIKPTNIMWNGEECKILDFGASQWVTERLSTRMTSNPVGTIGYIPPELVNDPKLIDKRIDCYSLGVLFYYLLIGSLPPVGNAGDNLNNNGVSEGIKDFILEALSSIEVRPENAGIMYEQLTVLNNNSLKGQLSS